MFQWGNYAANRLDIGKLDLAVLQDLGLKVKSTVGLPLVDVLDSQRPATALSANAVNENVGSGTTVATLTTQGGPDTTGGSFSLVAGFSDNSAFRISENRLLTDSLLDYEHKITHSLLIRFTDRYGVFTDTPLTVSVRDMTEAGPPNLVGTPGNRQVSLTWSAPVSSSGSPITDYIVQYRASTASDWITFPDGTSTATSATVAGLTNGTPYVFRVATVNGAGTGDYAQTLSITPYTVATAPLNLVGTAGNGQVSLTWSTPSSNGGSAITNYLVKYSANSGSTWTNFPHPVSTATSCIVTGLTNGTAYVIKVIARNTVGISLPSTHFFPATPAATVPSRPTAVVAVSGNTSLLVTWTAPANTGGSAITDYLVKYSANSGSTWTNFPHPVSTATSCTVTGLTKGTPYVIKVIAKNAVGISPASANSAPVTPATVPGIPTSVLAVVGNASLAVTWTAPANNGGSAITDYAVKYSSNSGSTWKTFVHPVSTATSCTVTGLTNGTSYIIKVIARNAVGIGPSSANSAPVTPATVPGIPTCLPGGGGALDPP